MSGPGPEYSGPEGFYYTKCYRGLDSDKKVIFDRLDCGRLGPAVLQGLLLLVVNVGGVV